MQPESVECSLVIRSAWLSRIAGRVLRLLATHHIFREVSPDVFTNNRISSLLDTGKPLEELSSLYVFLSKRCLHLALNETHQAP